MFDPSSDRTAFFGSRPATAWVAALAVVTLFAGRQAPAAEAVDYSDEVWSLSVPVSGPYGWNLDCEFLPGGVQDSVVAEATLHDDGWMPSGTSVYGRRSNSGQLVQIAGEQVSQQPREEQTIGTHTFSAGGSVGGSGRLAYFAVALWGGGARSCTITIDGRTPQPMRRHPGSHALYAGPEAFSGGAFAQDGATHISAGRIFARELSGGPLLGYLISARDAPAQSSIITDDPYYLAPVRLGSGSFARPAPRHVAVEVGFATEFEGRAHCQLYLINLPPEP